MNVQDLVSGFLELHDSDYSVHLSNWKTVSLKIKQLHHLLKTMRIFAWSQYLQKLVSVGGIRRFIFISFANKNFSRPRKAELLRKWIALVLQVNLFHGLPSKSKHPSISKVSVVVIITTNSISFYETAICREIFSKYFFASIFVNF